MCMCHYPTSPHSHKSSDGHLCASNTYLYVIFCCPFCPVVLIIPPLPPSVGFLVSPCTPLMSMCGIYASVHYLLASDVDIGGDAGTACPVL